MADMLLDATVFDDLRRGDSNARELIESILDGKVEAAVSPMTVCELWRRDDIDRQIEIGFLSVLRFVEEVSPNIDTARTAVYGLPITRKMAAAMPLMSAWSQPRLSSSTFRSARVTPEAFERFGVETIGY